MLTNAANTAVAAATANAAIDGEQWTESATYLMYVDLNRTHVCIQCRIVRSEKKESFSFARIHFSTSRYINGTQWQHGNGIQKRKKHKHTAGDTHTYALYCAAMCGVCGPCSFSLGPLLPCVCVTFDGLNKR